MTWTVFDAGNSIGQRGSEGGIILQNDEHSLGARITLEQDGSIAPFSITCGIYGWMFHTRFFGSQQEAESEYEQMKVEMADILNVIPLTSAPKDDEKMALVSDAISKFVERNP